MPEFVWLHFLFEEHGLKDGVALASKVALAANEVHLGDKIPSFAQVSSFSAFRDEQRSLILQKIPAHSLEKISDALTPLSIICPDNPLAFLIKPNHRKARPATAFSEKLAKLYDRHGREASWCNATAFYISAIHGKMKIVEHVADHAKEALKHIHEYPNTEQSKAAGAFFRAGAPMYLFGLEEDKSHIAWLEKFWGSVAGMGPCLGPTEFSPDPVPEDPLGKLIFSYRNALRLEMSTRIQMWGFDLNSIEKFEVIGALLARQTTLATELAASPNMWTPHCAPVILRAMADVHIAVAWILGDPEVRAKKFVDDGLGAIKLEIEHRKANLESAKREDPDEVAMLERLIDFWEAWLASQRLEDLVEVNLGSWSGINTRKMAEEAGCLSFYNFVYQPFSAAVHSNWAHISTKNLVYCENPAHRFHRIPVSSDEDYDVYWLYLAAKYVEKTFIAFDNAASIDCPDPKAIQVLVDQLEKRGGEAPET